AQAAPVRGGAALLRRRRRRRRARGSRRRTPAARAGLAGSRRSAHARRARRARVMGRPRGLTTSERMFLLSQARSPKFQCLSAPTNLLAFGCNKQGSLVYKHVFGETLDAPND